MTKERKLWARQCSVTSEGMDEGFLLQETIYVKYEKDLIKLIRAEEWTPSDEDGNEVQSISLTDDELMDWAYNEEIYYWTDWEEDMQYQEIDGVISEIEV